MTALSSPPIIFFGDLTPTTDEGEAAKKKPKNSKPTAAPTNEETKPADGPNSEEAPKTTQATEPNVESSISL